MPAIPGGIHHPPTSTKASRPGWPEPHPAALAARVDAGLRDLAAATPAAGTSSGQVGGCGPCTPCDVGAPERCHHPDSVAGRRHDADQRRAEARDAYHRAQLAVEFGLRELPSP
jgi:hypothetical protein